MEIRAMAVREENWWHTIQAGIQSGKSQKAWCAENGIAPSTFYYWKRQLRDRLLEAQGEDNGSEPCFAELPQPVAPAARTQDKILLHTENITVELPLGCREEDLCKVLRAVRHAR